MITQLIQEATVNDAIKRIRIKKKINIIYRQIFGHADVRVTIP